MTLCTVGHKEKVVEGKIYELDDFTLGEHYKVARYITRYEDGTVYKRYNVFVSADDRHLNYIPEIYHESDSFGDHRPEFVIQTTSYGALRTEEIDKVVAGYREAMEAVRILTMNFC